MLSTLFLSTLLAPAAPVPNARHAVASAPVIVELKPESDGALKLLFTRHEKKVISVLVIDPDSGRRFPIERTETLTSVARVPLTEVKDLKVFTAGGKEVKVADAAEQLKAGGVVLISTDGKKVDPVYTHVFKDEILVLVSPEFVTARPVSPSAQTSPLPPNGAGVQGTPLPEDRPILVTPPKKDEK